MKNLIFALAVSVSGALSAGTTAFQFSIFPPIQAPDILYDVEGFRLAVVYGECQQFRGFDLGISNRTYQDFAGFAIGGGNIVDCRMYGGQVGLVNWNSNPAMRIERLSAGAQIGAFSRSNDFLGFQGGGVNLACGKVSGMQCGFVNIAENIDGAQSGMLLAFGVNVVYGTLDGCQIGLVNYAENMEGGVQIGILNMIGKGGFLSVMPVVNFKF